MRTLLRLLTIGSLVIMILGAGGWRARVGAADQAAAVQIDAELTCLSARQADLALTIRNRGRELLTLSEDFHVVLSFVRAGGIEQGPVLFVFPGPDAMEIVPGGEQTFVLPLGGGEPGGEPGTDLRAHRIILDVEVFFLDHDQSVQRHVSLPGCTDEPSVGSLAQDGRQSGTWSNAVEWVAMAIAALGADGRQTGNWANVIDEVAAAIAALGADGRQAGSWG